MTERYDDHDLDLASSLTFAGKIFPKMKKSTRIKKLVGDLYLVELICLKRHFPDPWYVVDNG